MKRNLMVLTMTLAVSLPAIGQTSPEPPVWTEADRKYLLDNLTRTKREILNETKYLTKEQWNFRESHERWNINQIVEHLARWEMIWTYQISTALQHGPIPFEHYLSDSVFLDHDPEVSHPINTLDTTRPFSLGVPLGVNEGPNNILWLTTMRDESIAYLKGETKNLRQYYILHGPNVHQNYLLIINHTDRHLRQIRKVKMHRNYLK